MASRVQANYFTDLRIRRHFTNATTNVTPPFKKVLIANRGEIAIRIAKAAAGLNIPSVSVSSEQDSKALHSRVTSENVEIGQSISDPVQKYLSIEAIINAAKKHNCDCIHPGYGFLSENDEFVKRCEDNNIKFIGPTSTTIALFGSKVEARKLAINANVPVVPGSTTIFATGQDVQHFVANNNIGMTYPVMLKASNGGGGRGMRIVDNADDIIPAFESCQKEALNAFGNGDMFVEQYVQRPRHIEIQILADSKGNTIHLFERDCSVQLRNQKVMEIAPAPNLSKQTRENMYADAVKLVKAAKYENAGTVEFLYSPEKNEYYFIECNPRIQVEHTVTEQVTGIDLVETQFLIAAGKSLETLGLMNSNIQANGFAIQARVVATGEGTIKGYNQPSGIGIRVDGCGYLGLKPPPFYDPLFAKLVVFNNNNNKTFDQVVAKLKAALEEFHVSGLPTNLESLIKITDNSVFQNGEARTTFLTEFPDIMSNQSSSSKNSILTLLDEQSSKFSDGGINDEDNANAKLIAFNDKTPDDFAVVMEISGNVIKYHVAVGDGVKEGDRLISVVSMKMETVIRSPKEGVIVALQEDFKEGVNINPGDEIAIIRLQSVGEGMAEEEDEGWSDYMNEIEKRREFALAGSGEEKIAAHHAKGRLTVRERINILLDQNSFHEIGRIAGGSEKDENGKLISFTPGNFIIGTGFVDGRPIIACGEDFTMSGGSPNLAGLRKSIYTETLALELEQPLVRLHEGAGGSPAGADNRRKKGAKSAGPTVYGTPRFSTVAKCLQTIPVCTAAMGSVAGLPASRFVASHFAVMVKSAYVLTAGATVVTRALGYETTKEELGGIQIHDTSGIVDNFAEDEEDAMRQIRTFLSYLPSNVHSTPPYTPYKTDVDMEEKRAMELNTIIPRDRRQTYDMRQLISLIVDHGSFFEIGTVAFGGTQITGFARINGHVTGIYANDNRVLGGAMTADASDKVVRFMEVCQTFHVPIIALVDEPGFMIGIEAEKAGTIRRGTKAVLTSQTYPYPWCTLLCRKSYGVAAAAHFAPSNYVLSWPSVETGTLPVESGIAVAYKRELANHPNPEQRRKELEAQFSKGLK